jgi:hypothetical protein
MFLLNTKIVLSEIFQISADTSILLILVMFAVKVLIYFVVENFLAYKYSKFLFANWLLYFVFLIDSIINLKSQSISTQSQYLFVFEIALFGLTFVLFVFKLIKFIYNEFFLYKSFYNFF